jgi:anti-sigma B factor antagonist
VVGIDLEPQFTAVSRREGQRAVVRFEGELDCAVEGLARAEIEIALERGGSELVVNLGGLTFLDARGVHVLLDARRACRAQQRRLLLEAPPRCVERALSLCGVAESFERLVPAEASLRSRGFEP